MAQPIFPEPVCGLGSSSRKSEPEIVALNEFLRGESNSFWQNPDFFSLYQNNFSMEPVQVGVPNPSGAKPFDPGLKFPGKRSLL